MTAEVGVFQVSPKLRDLGTRESDQRFDYLRCTNKGEADVLPLQIPERYRRAPRKVIAVESSSAFRPAPFRRDATALRAFAAELRGSRKTSTDGPAPLSAAPKIPSLPFNS